MNTAPTTEELTKEIEELKRYVLCQHDLFDASRKVLQGYIDDLKVDFVRLYDLIEAHKREADNRFEDLNMALTPVFRKTLPTLLDTLCDIDDVIGKPSLAAPERLTPAPSLDFVKLATSKTSN